MTISIYSINNKVNIGATNIEEATKIYNKHYTDEIRIITKVTDNIIIE